MKYIVYKTTNLVNNYIYIGVHQTENPNVFDGYLGCGIIINRPSTYKYSKTCLQTAINTYGVKNFKRETLAIFDTEEEAYFLEEQLVNENFLARNDVYNMVLGGSHDLAIPVKCYKYSSDGDYIEAFDSLRDACRSVNKSFSAIHAAITFKTKCGGFYWNTDKVDKLDISNYKTTDAIKIYCYNVSDGKFYEEFDSITQASIKLKFTTVQISRSAKLGYRVGDYLFSFIKRDSYDAAKTEYIKNRPVFKYSNEGVFIEEYKTQAEAELANPNSNITQAIKNKQVCKNNFLWGLQKLDVFNSTKSKKIKIGKFDLDGNLIETYSSIKECCLKVGIPRAYITVGKKYKDYIYHSI